MNYYREDSKMSLKETLDNIKTKFENSAPVEVINVMHRTLDDLRLSGLPERALKVGDRVPDFTLTDTKGNTITLASCLEKGPLVLTFFRGQW